MRKEKHAKIVFLLLWFREGEKEAFWIIVVVVMVVVRENVFSVKIRMRVRRVESFFECV